jgi:hypothetical protein
MIILGGVVTNRKRLVFKPYYGVYIRCVCVSYVAGMLHMVCAPYPHTT